MIYPVDSLRKMAEKPGLQEFWELAPELLELEDWPDCTYWQAKLEEQAGFRALPLPLRLQPEVKIGQRRKRKLTKQNQEAGRPTLRRYESSIIEDRLIPMRERNLHDFFNALIWMRFPQAKYALHERAYRSYLEGPRLVTGNLRNDLTDALTRFDEGGVVCFVESVADAVAVFRGTDQETKERFVREHAGSFRVFGHGLLEVWSLGKYKVTASLLIVPCIPGRSSDAALADCLGAMEHPYRRFGTIDMESILGI